MQVVIDQIYPLRLILLWYLKCMPIEQNVTAACVKPVLNLSATFMKNSTRLYSKSLLLNVSLWASREQQHLRNASSWFGFHGMLWVTLADWHWLTVPLGDFQRVWTSECWRVWLYLSEHASLWWQKHRCVSDWQCILVHQGSLLSRTKSLSQQFNWNPPYMILHNTGSLEVIFFGKLPSSK